MPASIVVVCPPTWIQSNPETAATNAYQQTGDDELIALAQRQFEEFLRQLMDAGIEVRQLAPPPGCPDAVFPNNWFATMPDGHLVFFPMMAPSRRAERQIEPLLDLLGGQDRWQVVHFEREEELGNYLEGTGSLVFDHQNRIGYAALSPRTTEKGVESASRVLDFEPLIFHASDAEVPVYHTNVVMSVGSDFAVICLEAIEERLALKAKLESTGKTVIDISREQMREFCGNIIELAGPVILMSDRAYSAFRPDQLEALAQGRKVIHPDISAIESMGGGSARCMVAEVFLPKAEG